jgi:hypothetical protein
MRKVLLAGFILFGLMISSSSLITIGQKPKEEPTPVTRGVATPRQKEHGKLYPQDTGLGKLSTLIGNDKLDRSKEINLTVLPSTPELSIDGTTESLGKLVSSSDAIVLGTVLSKTSQLTENETFVFTDYEVTISEVLKTKVATIHPQKVITVTRPGGKILLEGVIVNAVDRNFKPLAIGASVLLFLKYLPATDSYQAVNNKSSFELLNNKVKPLSDAPDAKKQRGDVTSFLGDIRAAIASNGEAKGGR